MALVSTACRGGSINDLFAEGDDPPDGGGEINGSTSVLDSATATIDESSAADAGAPIGSGGSSSVTPIDGGVDAAGPSTGGAAGLAGSGGSGGSGGSAIDDAGQSAIDSSTPEDSATADVIVPIDAAVDDYEPPVCVDDTVVHSGAFSYGSSVGTSPSCSFPLNGDRMIASVGPSDYAGSAACGACVRVFGAHASVVVKVVDECASCALGEMELTAEAFLPLTQTDAEESGQEAGADAASEASIPSVRVMASWMYVPCEVQGPIAYRFDPDSSEDWAGVQIRNHRYPIAKVEYKQVGESFVPLERESYDYFVDPAGMGAGPFTFRVTDVHGQVLEDVNVPFAPGDTILGIAQFPPCDGADR